MIKIANAEGDWGFFARLTDRDKNKLTGIKERDEMIPQENSSFLLQWEIAGPYFQEKMGPQELFDVVFPPESGAMSVSWKLLDLAKIDYSPKWTITDGAVQVLPGAGSIMTKQLFNDYHMHLEFRSPFMPGDRGQARGNSGVYNQGRYEVQVLDNYGMEGKDNECGGIYKVAPPAVNMCGPPTHWQTYDIDFRAARYDNDKKIESARITVVHNGVTIHDNQEVPVATVAGMDTDMSKPGPVVLQDHGDPVQYRNIWLVEK
jgi:hypothetical protein